MPPQMKLRERKRPAAARHHPSEDAVDKPLLHVCAFRAAQGIQPPESEEHRDLAAHSKRTVGDDERRKHFIEVTAENNDGLMLLALDVRQTIFQQGLPDGVNLGGYL